MATVELKKSATEQTAEDLTPYTQEEINNMIDESMADYRAGRILTCEEAHKLIEEKFEDNYRPKTKTEILADFDKVCKEIKLAREGKIKGRPAEELLNEL